MTLGPAKACGGQSSRDAVPERSRRSSTLHICGTSGEWGPAYSFPGEKVSKKVLAIAARFIVIIKASAQSFNGSFNKIAS